MITLSLDGKRRFKAETRGHKVIIDVPPEKGGDDKGMMPTELYTTALSTCIGITMAVWLEKNNLPTDGLTIIAKQKMALTPRKIESIKFDIRLRENLSAEQKKELQELLTACPVMLSLKQPPATEIIIRNP